MISGGFVPQGRRAEDGRISEKYPNLLETETQEYAERTEANILHSDATIILSHGKLTGGSLLTVQLVKRHQKPFLHLDFLELDSKTASLKAKDFLSLIKCKTLNIAGPRASDDPKIYPKTKDFLERLFE